MSWQEKAAILACVCIVLQLAILGVMAIHWQEHKRDRRTRQQDRETARRWAQRSHP